MVLDRKHKALEVIWIFRQFFCRYRVPCRRLDVLDNGSWIWGKRQEEQICELQIRLGFLLLGCLKTRFGRSASFRHQNTRKTCWRFHSSQKHVKSLDNEFKIWKFKFPQFSASSGKYRRTAASGFLFHGRNTLKRCYCC